MSGPHDARFEGGPQRAAHWMAAERAFIIVKELESRQEFVPQKRRRVHSAVPANSIVSAHIVAFVPACKIVTVQLTVTTTAF